jgi:RNA polymerase sigma-70 factor (ECF subfamily)
MPAEPSTPEVRSHADQAAVGGRDTGFDAASEDWPTVLRATDGSRDAAIARLHQMLVRIALREVNRRAPRLHIAGPELDDIAYQAAADALLAIIDKVDEFRGESRFTTWAYKFVVFEVSAKVGRHFWRDPRATLDAEDWQQLPDRLGLPPDRASEWRDLIAEIQRVVDHELTPHQRRVFVAVVLNAVPLDAVVVKLGSSRNAIYKTLFDARRKLRATLAANGYLDDSATVRRP